MVMTQVLMEWWYFRNYSINQRTLFDENYALASTQALKNKDIPEGGAKGTILPS
jgi:glutamate dehydrogenase